MISVGVFVMGGGKRGVVSVRRVHGTALGVMCRKGAFLVSP